MKRGLVATEVPETTRAACAARVQRLRARLREAGCDAALIYGDVSRSDDIYYLANLCLYWNEGVLVVPARGEVTFATKLSPRVHPWMRATSVVSELHSGPNLPKLICEALGGAGSRRVGVVEHDWWPGALLDDLAVALGQSELVDLVDAVRRDRLEPDEAELAQLRDLGCLAATGLLAAGELEGKPADRIAAIERVTRAAGATDVFAAAEDAADGSASVGVIVQLGHLWLRAARSGGGALADHAAFGAAQAAAALRDGATLASVASAVTAPASGEIALRTECVCHVDLGPGGARFRAEDSDKPLRSGEVATIAVTAVGPAGRAAYGDTYLVAHESAATLSAVSEACR